jgi:hypothetical protein
MIKIKTRKCQPVNVTNSDQSYTETIASGGLLVLPDTTIEVNGLSQGSVVAVATLDIQLSNIDGVVTPLSVTQTGNDLSVVLPTTVCPPAIQRSTATLMKTGQTTSYRTGDDGDIEAGRESDFLTLDSAPLHNDGTATINTTTNRFTDTLGGQTYANDIVLDWSTWNGSTLLGWYKSSTIISLTWNGAIDWAIALSVDLFTTGWFLPNLMQFISISKTEDAQQFNYFPFNLTLSHFTSNTSKRSIGTAYLISSNSDALAREYSKTLNRNTQLATRTFNLSTSNILS